MTTKKAIEILKHHNIWRRGETDDPKYRPKDIGLAIDKAVEVMEKQVCKNCGERWYIDSEAFGCWVCGYESESK